MHNEIKTGINTGINMVTFRPSYCLKEKGTTPCLSGGIKFPSLKEMKISDMNYNYASYGMFKKNKRNLTINGDTVNLQITNRSGSFILVGTLIKIEPLIRKNTSRKTQKNNEVTRFIATKFNCTTDYVLKVIKGQRPAKTIASRESEIKNAYDTYISNKEKFFQLPQSS